MIFDVWLCIFVSKMVSYHQLSQISLTKIHSSNEVSQKSIVDFSARIEPEGFSVDGAPDPGVRVLGEDSTKSQGVQR